MKKQKLFYIFICFISLFKIFERRFYNNLKKEILSSIENSKFQSMFIRFDTISKDKDSKTVKIKGKRGYLSLNDDGIHYVSGFLTSTLTFIPFKDIKKIELTQRVGEVSLTKRSIHIFLKNGEDFYIFLIDGDARKCLGIIEEHMKRIES